MTTIQNDAEAMSLALSLATRAPRAPTNFRVGAVIVHAASGRVVATGHTGEIPGNTHAEECCLRKLAEVYRKPRSEDNVPKDDDDDDNDIENLILALPSVLTEPHTLYTTLEPCARRLSGRPPCVGRVLAQRSWLTKVCYGFSEPDTFVGVNDSEAALRRAGVEVVCLGDGGEMRRVAVEGHV